MLRLLRTDSDNNDFRDLVAILDSYLAEVDGDDNAFYSQYNKIDMLRHAVVAYDGITPVGCGAVKQFGSDAMEVKRMFTQHGHRKKGVAKAVLSELEKWSAELGYTRCVLETGKRQPEAIALYERQGYRRTPNYGQYVGMENSVCFEKLLVVGS
jgi:GNAT superfamily N-acetyltransferase